MLSGLAAWFATSRTGRTIAAAGALLLAVGVAVLKVFNAGKQVERDRQDRQSLENLRNRQELDNEIDNLGSDDLDRRGRRWVRPSE